LTPKEEKMKTKTWVGKFGNTVFAMVRDSYGKNAADIVAI
jgi:hypothetical protein